jgi:hypothetical protein
MRLSIFISLVACALSVSGAVHQVQGRDGSKDAPRNSEPIPGNGSELPGSDPIDPTWKDQIYPLDSINEKDIKYFPKKQTKGDHCSTEITFEIVSGQDVE